MAAVILPQYRANLAQPIKYKERAYFNADICPCAYDIVYAEFKDVRIFVNYLWALLKFSCAKNYGWMYQSPSFFLTKDSNTLMVMFKFHLFLFVLSSINLCEGCIYPLM